MPNVEMPELRNPAVPNIRVFALVPMKAMLHGMLIPRVKNYYSV